MQRYSMRGVESVDEAGFVKFAHEAVMVQFGKISYGVYPEHGRRVRDDRSATLFVISSGRLCENSHAERKNGQAVLL